MTHVGDPGFGLEDKVRDLTLKNLQNLFENSPRLVSTEAQILLRDIYEVDFNIYRHDHPQATSPLGLVLMNWNEDTVSQGQLRERLEQYIDVDIFKYFHLSFQEWVDQPSYLCDLQIEIASDRIRKEAPKLEEAERALKEVTNKRE